MDKDVVWIREVNRSDGRGWCGVIELVLILVEIFTP